MDVSLADYALSMDPAQQQAYQAQAIRQRQRTEGENQLAEAIRRAHSGDLMAAMSSLANNPALVQAAQSAQKSTQSQYMPERLGNQGFMLPGSGQFVESDIYADEKKAARDAQQSLQQSRLDQQKSVLQQTLEAQAERAAAREQGANERASALNQTRLMIAGMRPNPQAKVDAKAEADKEKAVTKYSTQLEHSAVPEFQEALSIAEGRLSQHKVGQLPGYGRFEGAIPDAFATTEMQATRTDMQQAANILLKARSGAAVTDSEQKRFLREIATGAGMSEEAMRHGWDNLRKSFNAKVQNLTSGASPEVHDEYVARGGVDFRQAIKRRSTDSAPTAGRIRYDAQGNEVK